MSSDTNNPSLVLTKKEKGRYKKLLKRSRNYEPSRHVSGLTAVDDWKELQQLVERNINSNGNSEQQLIGPSVTLREGYTRTSPIDAADHRDILFRLLMMQKSSDTSTNANNNSDRDKKDDEVQKKKIGKVSPPHKRKRCEETIDNGTDGGCDDDDGDKRRNHHSNSQPIQSQQQSYNNKRWQPPHWVCVHNSACFESAAVLELHVSAIGQMKSTVTAVEKLVTNSQKKRCTVVPTTWYPNLHHPQSISSALLYSMTNNNHNNKKKKNKNNSTKAKSCSATTKSSNPSNSSSNPIDLVYDNLLPLALTEDEQKAEGYPTVVLVNDQLTTAVEEGDCGGGKEEDDDQQILKCSRVTVSSPHGDDPRLPKFVSTSAAKAAAEVTTGSNDTTAAAAAAAVEEDGGSNSSPQRQRRIFALDCEMVQTTIGSELARATLVELVGLIIEEDDNNSNIRMETSVCFDWLVKPEHPVVDYLTMYSGITKQKLQDAQNENQLYTLQQVQIQMLYFVKPNDILIGHSLENDLIAMRCLHGRVVDTATLFRPDKAKFKYSLRHLSAALLRKNLRQQNQLQQQSDNDDSNSGNGGVEKGQHCSQEDAEAALELAVRRAWEGPSFGATLKRKKAHSNQLIELASSSSQQPVVCIGPSEWLQQHVLQPPSSIHALTCESIDDRNRQAVTAWLSSSSQSSSSNQRRKRAKLVWAHWKSYDQKDNNNHEEKFLKLLEELLSKISPTTMVVIAIQVGYEETAKMTAERRARMKPRATFAWTEQEQTNWLKRVHACRNGTVLWIGGNKQK